MCECQALKIAIYEVTPYHKHFFGGLIQFIVKLWYTCTCKQTSICASKISIFQYEAKDDFGTEGNKTFKLSITNIDFGILNIRNIVLT